MVVLGQKDSRILAFRLPVVYTIAGEFIFEVLFFHFFQALLEFFSFFATVTHIFPLHVDKGLRKLGLSRIDCELVAARMNRNDFQSIGIVRTLSKYRLDRSTCRDIG